MTLIIGIIYGSLITLIDQLIEHNLLNNKILKKILSILFVLITFGLLVIINLYYKDIIPFLIGLNLYWLLVGKIHDLEFILYIIGFFLITIFLYKFQSKDLFIIIFTILYNLFFKLKGAKKMLNRGKLGLFLYRFMGRYYIISIIFILFFNNTNSGLFNIGSTIISFILAKKYIFKN